MKNRFNVTLRKGMQVAVTHPRGGIVEGKIAKIETRGEFVQSYGPRVTLDNGFSASADDCTPLLDYLRRKVRSLESEISSFTRFGPIAWTGGVSSSSVKPSDVPTWEKAYARTLFREQVNTFRHAWKDAPEWDTLRIFYNRARADAFATFRDAFNR